MLFAVFLEAVGVAVFAEAHDEELAVFFVDFGNIDVVEWAIFFLISAGAF